MSAFTKRLKVGGNFGSAPVNVKFVSGAEEFFIQREFAVTILLDFELASHFYLPKL